MLRSVTWRLYAAVVAVLGLDFGLGAAYNANANVEMWTSRIGWVALIFAPLVVVAAYALSQQKWWQNTLGTGLVLLCFAYLPIAIPLAWVFAFDNGKLTNTWLGWFFVSGPFLSSLVLLFLSFVFLLIRKDRELVRSTDHDGDA
jgi:hypothetical protein